MRTYDESVGVLISLLDRHPGSKLELTRHRGNWRARLALEVPYNEIRNRIQITEAYSCEPEKALDSLASKALEMRLT